MDIIEAKTKTEAELLDEEIQAAEKEAAEIELRTFESTTIERKRTELAAKRRKIEDANVIARITEKHGLKGVKWDSLDTSAGLVCLAKPEGPLARFYTRWCDDGQSLKKDELMKLVTPLLLNPTKSEFEKWCDIDAATPIRTANLANALAGARTKDLEGK